MRSTTATKEGWTEAKYVQNSESTSLHHPHPLSPLSFCLINQLSFMVMARTTPIRLREPSASKRPDHSSESALSASRSSVDSRQPPPETSPPSSRHTLYAPDPGIVGEPACCRLQPLAIACILATRPDHIAVICVILARLLQRGTANGTSGKHLAYLTLPLPPSASPKLSYHPPSSLLYPPSPARLPTSSQV